MADNENQLPPPPIKKESANFSGDGNLLPLPPKKKSIAGGIGGIEESTTSVEPYTWEGFGPAQAKAPEVLPTATTFATAKPEQAKTGIPTEPTPGHKPELKMISVDPEQKLPEQKAKENPAFEAITSAFVDFPEAFADMGGTTGRDNRIEFYKRAYEKSRAKDKTFNAKEFESLVIEAENKWNDANELQEYTKLLAKDPDNINYQYAVGFRQMNLGKTQAAVDNFKAIIAKNPKYSPAYSAMAYLYSDKEQHEVAVTFMDDAIENNPNDAALYSNRSIIKQRGGDVQGALKDLDAATSKTENKSLQLEIEKQYIDIFQRLHQNRDNKADKAIAIIRGEFNPQDAETDKDFFRQRYNEHKRNALVLAKDINEENLKGQMERIKKGDLSGIPQGITVPEQMEGYIRGKGMREAMESLIYDPREAGIAGLIMNPVGFIARTGIEGVVEGAKEVKKGIVEGKPLKTIKGVMQGGIAGIMATTPVGWAFTGTSAALEAIPYGHMVEEIAFAPVSILTGSDSDAAAIGDLIVAGVLLHGANKGLKGSKQALAKSKKKEAFTPNDVGAYKESLESMTEAETAKVLKDAGIPEGKIGEISKAEISPERDAFVEKQIKTLETEGELSAEVPKEIYEDYFRNKYDQANVKEGTKLKLTDAQKQSEHFGDLSDAQSERLETAIKDLESKAEGAEEAGLKEVIKQSDELLAESKKTVTSYVEGKATRIPLEEALKPEEVPAAKAKVEKPVTEAEAVPPIEKEVLPEAKFVTTDKKYTVEKTPEGLKITDKKGEIPSPKTERKIIKEYEQTVDFVSGKKASDIAKKEKVEFANPEEANRYVAEKSENPLEIVRALEPISEFESKKSYVDQVLDDYVTDIDPISYARHGDRNNIGPIMAKRLLKKDGKQIDTLAQEVSEVAGLEVTPQDIVNFMENEKYERKTTDIQKALHGRFKDITGLTYNEGRAQRAIEQELNEHNKNYEQYLETEAKTFEQAEQQYYEAIKRGDIPHEKAKDVGAAEVIREGRQGRRVVEKEEGVPTDIPASTKKAYESIAGMEPRGQQGRVPVAPIIGAPIKDISQIIFDVTKQTKQRLFIAKGGGGGRRKSLGTYDPGNTAIKIKFSGDLDTTAHEIGHSIDDFFGILSDLVKEPNLKVEVELNKFSPFGSKAPKGHPNPRLYEYGEGFAEFLRAYIVNPEKAKTEAPNLYKLYESKVHPEYRKAVDSFSTDIRSWAGSTGRDMVLSNVEWKPEQKKGIIGEIFEKSEPNNMFSITWADKVAANFINPLRAFEKANEYAKGLKKIDKQLPENDPILLSRTLLGIDGKLSDILETGMIDSRMNLLKDKKGNYKTLKWLIEPLDNSDISTIESGMKDVMAYMVAERTVELSKKFKREDVLSGIGAGIYKDVDVAKKALEEFKKSDPANQKNIKEAADRYREMSDDVLKYMVDKGRLSKENYDQIKKDNTQYVAMKRVIETEPGKEIEVYKASGGKLGSKTDVIHKIKGSTRKIQNPYTALLDLIYRGVKEADRNESLLVFRNMLTPKRANMYDGTPLRLADIGTRVKLGEKETITIFVDGKPEYWKFQTDIYKALKGLDNEGYKLPPVLTALPRALRWTVTNFPIFAIRNVVRDFQDRIIKSNENTYKNLYGIKDLFGAKKHWNEVARAGGLNAGFYMKDRAHYYGLMEFAMKDVAKSKKSILADPTKITDAWKGYQSILQKGETLNRVAEYRAAFRNAKKKGMDDYNAKLYGALKSRDLLDFALMGHWMKIANQLIPFSNAAVQGMRSAAVRAKENPMGFVSRMVAFSVMPSTAIWFLNNKDVESRKQYNELPDYQRDLFYNFKIGDNRWLSIPKPYELSLPGAAVERGLSFYAGDEKAFDGYAGSVAKSTLPFDEASFAGGFQAIIEGTTNYDYFRDKAIIPPREQALDLALRNTERASRLGKALQEVAGIDARKIDHFIKGSFSYFGKTALELSDIGKEDEPNPFTLSDLGFFKKSPAYNSKSVQEFLRITKEGQFTSTFPYREFGALTRKYFDAETDAEKERLSKLLTEYAKSSIPLMEKALDRKRKLKKAKKDG